MAFPRVACQNAPAMPTDLWQLSRSQSVDMRPHKSMHLAQVQCLEQSLRCTSIQQGTDSSSNCIVSLLNVSGTDHGLGLGLSAKLCTSSYRSFSYIFISIFFSTAYLSFHAVFHTVALFLCKDQTWFIYSRLKLILFNKIIQDVIMSQ